MLKWPWRFEIRPSLLTLHFKVKTSMTNNPYERLDDLREIRRLMERSSRFISLSGLSGIGTGCFALLGAFLAYSYLGTAPWVIRPAYYDLALEGSRWGMNYITFFLLDGALVLLGALGSGIFFTTRRARRRGLPVWDQLTRRMLVNLLLPLLAGGLFMLGLFFNGALELIVPSTLVFYGLALVNASKYTLYEIRLLGLTEVALGTLAVFLPNYGLLIWAVGFGLLHILYGAMMYFKYER